MMKKEKITTVSRSLRHPGTRLSSEVIETATGDRQDRPQALSTPPDHTLKVGVSHKQPVPSALTLEHLSDHIRLATVHSTNNNI